MLNQSKKQLMNAWEVSWPVLGVLVGGQSSIDLQSLDVRDWSDATQFVLSYGYDANLPEHRKFIHSIIVEALSFIERHLMPDEWRRGIVPPDEVLLCDDVRTLLLYASGHNDATEHHRRWSCAVLRVMHTIAHIEGVHKAADFEAASEQIEKRFMNYMNIEADGTCWLGEGDLRVPLHKVEWKRGKGRDSIILKLLHKRANVAETIHDILGVRIVTSKLCDVILAVRLMQHFYMVTFPNCNPSRARNTLLDLDTFRSEMERIKKMLKDDDISAAEFQALATEISAPIQNLERSNPHSASAYQAIQFTCRQLIRWPNPLLGWLTRMDQVEDLDADPNAKKTMDRLVSLVRGWLGVEQSLELSAFFPFEVQILDRRAYRQNQFGEAAHDKYKRSQSRAARRRVLTSVLELYQSRDG